MLPNTFYLYYCPVVGCADSTDGGTSLDKNFAGQITLWSNFNSELQSVPGKGGDLISLLAMQESVFFTRPIRERPGNNYPMCKR